MNYWRIATASPVVKVADVAANTQEILATAREAAAQGARILLFPELSLTGYTCGDLFLQNALLDKVALALQQLAEELPTSLLTVVGAPMLIGSSLYDCAVMFAGGEIVNVVTKSTLANYGGCHESRYFHSTASLNAVELDMEGSLVPLNALVCLSDASGCSATVGVEFGEDLRSVLPPSREMAVEGATILLNLQAQPEAAGSASAFTSLLKAHSASLLAAYAVASAGPGESTTDAVYGGSCYIAENGTLLASGTPFQRNGQLLLADVDVENLEYSRRFHTSFGELPDLAVYEIIDVDLDETVDVPEDDQAEMLMATAGDMPQTLLRPLDPHPFIPADPVAQKAYCQEVLELQAQALVTRMQHVRSQAAVVGVSGGLDSTLALLVTCRAFDLMGLPRENVYGITMPGLGTSQKTKDLASTLMDSLGITHRTISIKEASQAHLANIGHDGVTTDAAYENAQARERTQVIMDVANMVNGLVIGTGDLSEIALGWCTYNGDHMSMYGVNGSVPKTLIRAVVLTAAEEVGGALGECLTEIVHAPVSPELLPVDANGDIAQKTEEIVGAYELHDFFLYRMAAWGETPTKIYALAKQAFAGVYEEAEIKRCLGIFYRRFFMAQFKRSCSPDGAGVTMLSLSPRGTWKMPSDACMTLWMEEIQQL